jgi:hypothetical protein
MEELVYATQVDEPEEGQIAYGDCEHSQCFSQSDDVESYIPLRYSSDYERWYCSRHYKRVQDENKRLARREAADYEYMFGSDDTDPDGSAAAWEQTQDIMREGGLFDGHDDEAPTIEEEIAGAAEKYRQATQAYLAIANDNGGDFKGYLAADNARRQAEAEMFALLEKAALDTDEQSVYHDFVAER